MNTYCQNILTIAANESTDGIPATLYVDINHEVDYMGLSFEQIMPVPEELNGAKDFEEIIQWKIENWGTYGLFNSGPRTKPTKEDFLILKFETYETPPLLWLQRLSSLHDELIFDINYFNILKNISGSRSFISGIEIEEEASTATPSAWEHFGYSEDAYSLFIQNNK